jgi:predicted 2-oxoglutarate/Fe(II)-dependent dioxygenase YbiX
MKDPNATIKADVKKIVESVKNEVEAAERSANKAARARKVVEQKTQKAAHLKAALSRKKKVDA